MGRRVDQADREGLTFARLTGSGTTRLTLSMERKLARGMRENETERGLRERLDGEFFLIDLSFSRLTAFTASLIDSWDSGVSP